MKVFNLISGPRNLSTALMYSFAQRPDTRVMDEPFYGYYLKNAFLKAPHPSQQEIVDSMELVEAKIVENINALSKNANVFVKGMAHHYLSKEPEFILDWKNILLIRHPKKLIASFAKIIHTPTLRDIGVEKAAELYVFLKKKGKEPIIIDSDELLKNPKGYLTKLCAKLQIPFSEEMLQWKSGGIPEDGIWAKHWYNNVHNSEGFCFQNNQKKTLPKHLEPLLEEALPYYEKLKNNILTND